MRKRLFGLLSVLVCAALAMACAESDADITEKIKSEISTDRTITNASNIDVSTRGHVVTLSGTVESPIAKERALTLARGTPGAKRVVDNLTVAPAAPAAAAAPQASASAHGQERAGKTGGSASGARHSGRGEGGGPVDGEGELTAHGSRVSVFPLSARSSLDPPEMRGMKAAKSREMASIARLLPR